MKPKEFYEESWRLQREREEVAASERPSPLSRLKHRLSVSRYDIAARFIRSMRPVGEKFLDVGCGRGEMIERLLPLFEQLIGIDAAVTEMERYRASVAGDVGRKIVARAVDLNGAWPFASSSFDVVACLAVLEHLVDPYAAARELTRVLKPRGLLVVETPNIAYVKYRLTLLVGKFPATSGDPLGWDGGHLHYFTQGSLVDLFMKYGCRPCATAGAGFLSRMRSLRPSLLCGDCVIAFEKE